MKYLIIAILALSLSAEAQQFPALDKSPLDMSYYPTEFPHDRKFAPEKVGPKALVRILYSRTARKDRMIFGGLIPFDEVWRVGANEAPEIKFYEDVSIAGRKVKKGTYTLFVVPSKIEWTIILNSDLDVFGAYSYDTKKDVFKTTIVSSGLSESVENLSIQFVKVTNKQAKMQLAWDKTMIELPIDFK